MKNYVNVLHFPTIGPWGLTSQEWTGLCQLTYSKLRQDRAFPISGIGGEI